MSERRLDRRRFLSAAGAGTLAAIAGCTSRNAQTQAPTGGTESASDGAGDGTVADESRYTEIYEQTIDSVTFLRVFGIESPLTDETGQGQGSGFLYDENHVVTNEHVVARGEEVDVRYPTDDWANAELVGTDYFSDLAVLEVDAVPDSAEPLPLAEEEPSVGQVVLAIGNPFGLEGSMSQGIVSGVNRSLDMPNRRFTFPNVIQTDTAINPGNSGGPLVDLDGEVLGVINAGGGENIGFAISAALTERVVTSLLEDGEYEHPYMGVGLETVDPVVAEVNDLEEATGVMVAEVVDGTPADGVLQGREDQVSRHGDPIPVGGDVILAIDGEPIPDRHALSSYLALEASPGDTVEVDIIRDGERGTVDLTLGAREEPDDRAAPFP